MFKPDKLVYFFYGRPAYRPSHGDEAVSLPALMPVCLLFRPEAVRHIKRIAPFDTGGFRDELFKKHMHPRMKVDDFLLDCAVDMPGRVVTCFFGSNRAYFFGQPRTLSIASRQHEAESYQSLISDKGSTTIDDRRATIEIQTDRSIAIGPKSVLLVVLPTALLDDDFSSSLSKKWSAEVARYSTHHCNPREYQSRMFEEVEKYLIKHHYMKPE
ncbi:MAG TPA: hypothetical protein VK598_04765 [Nitrospiraceae bacterium]|nr:hypothetical protein [Nitrospiraceae bacterium]